MITASIASRRSGRVKLHGWGFPPVLRLQSFNRPVVLDFLAITRREDDGTTTRTIRKSLFRRVRAASRSATLSELTTLRLLRLSTLPPLMRWLGLKPSQEVNFFSSLQALTSVPISKKTFCAVCKLIPSMRVRSTPLIRYSSSRRSSWSCWLIPGRLRQIL